MATAILCIQNKILFTEWTVLLRKKYNEEQKYAYFQRILTHCQGIASRLKLWKILMWGVHGTHEIIFVINARISLQFSPHSTMNRRITRHPIVFLNVILIVWSTYFSHITLHWLLLIVVDNDDDDDDDGYVVVIIAVTVVVPIICSLQKHMYNICLKRASDRAYRINGCEAEIVHIVHRNY